MILQFLDTKVLPDDAEHCILYMDALGTGTCQTVLGTTS